MSKATPTLKRHNHRVHPCKNEKKEELLALLLSQNLGKKIIVVSSLESTLTTEQANVSIVSDRELYKNPELTCELLISYDLPEKAIVYMSRITKSTSHALILLDPSEEKLLHPIETLNGRTVMQERVEGFSEVLEEKVAQPTKKDSDPREDRKRAFIDGDKKKSFGDKKPYGDRPKRDNDDKKPWDKKPYGDKPKRNFDDKKPYGDKKPYADKKPYGDKPKRDGDKKSWDKTDKPQSVYIGKDEKGKSIFSEKSGERNHGYDGKPKGRSPRLTGKKIAIKTLKKKEEES